MTRILTRALACAVCGRAVELPWLAESTRLEGDDLDTRPAMMERGTIAIWVAECPGGGYCAYDLSTAPPGAAALVGSEAYRAVRADRSRRALANRFLCASLLRGASGEHARAFWAALHAAWTCDDDDRFQAASLCRGVALGYARRALAAGQAIDGGEVVLADVLRRAARWKEAGAIVRKTLAARPPAAVEALLVFEKRLIARKDAGCHTVEEARARA